MEKETKQGVSGGVLFLIVILCLGLGLTSGYIIHDKLSNNGERNTTNNKKANENDNKEKEEKNINNDSSKEKETYSIEIPSDCTDKKDCVKTYDFSLKGNNHTLKVYNISTATLDNSSYFTIDDQKIEAKKGGFEFIDKFAVIDNSIFVISGRYSNGDWREIIYLDSNLNVKTDIEGMNYEDDQQLTSKTNTYTTCEVKTCDDQIKRKYSYRIDDDATIKDVKLEKEENKFCSAQC